MSVRGLRRYEAFARAEIAAATFLVWSLLALLGRTVRWTHHGAAEIERCWQGGEPVLMAFWHGRAIMLPFVYRGRGASIMNSTHRDGEIVSRVIAKFGVESTRGSSTRGAVAGLLGLVRANRRGRDLALIPDGPKGPPGIAKGGAAELLLATGAPLFPMAVSCSKGWRLPTWDRLMIPYPFAKMVLVVGEPLRVAAGEGRLAKRAVGANKDRLPSREQIRLELERRLRLATAEADRLAGRVCPEET